MGFTRIVREDDRLTVINTTSWLGWVCLVLFGVPGVAGVLVAWQIAGDPTRQPGAAVALACLGVLVAMFGVAVFTLAHMTIVDRREAAARSGWSTLGFWWSRSVPLSSLQGISITVGTVSRVPRFFVHLVGMTPQRVLLMYVTEHATAEDARATAVELASFTGLEVFEDNA